MSFDFNDFTPDNFFFSYANGYDLVTNPRTIKAIKDDYDIFVVDTSVVTSIEKYLRTVITFNCKKDELPLRLFTTGYGIQTSLAQLASDGRTVIPQKVIDTESYGTIDYLRPLISPLKKEYVDSNEEMRRLSQIIKQQLMIYKGTLFPEDVGLAKNDINRILSSQVPSHSLMRGKQVSSNDFSMYILATLLKARGCSVALVTKDTDFLCQGPIKDRTGNYYPCPDIIAPASFFDLSSDMRMQFGLMPCRYGIFRNNLGSTIR